MSIWKILYDCHTIFSQMMLKEATEIIDNIACIFEHV